MKKKKLVMFVFLLIGVLSLILAYKFKQNNLSKNKSVKEEKLSIMIKEDGANDYTKSSSKDIPKGNYTLNTEKSYCKNNGKIEGYDSVTGTVSFAFIGTDKCFLYFDVPPRKAYDAILLDNGNGVTTVDEAKTYISGKGIPTFANIATTNEGMYATEDDLGTSYYFRGAVDNNWIKFGEIGGKSIYWRIIRINGDGSIRMIYTGTTAPSESQKVVMTGEGTQIGESAFNSNYNKAEHAGYMYTEGQQHGNSTSSDIKNALENWYAGTTLKDNSLVSQDQIFCNDRSVTYGTWSSTASSYLEYGAVARLSASPPSPQLKCPTESDKFSSKESSIGNKTLEYPVGLITADEIEIAGGKGGSSNSSYYLYTNESYWSGSPFSFSDGNRVGAWEFRVEGNSSFTAHFVDYTFGARPVISLYSEAKLSGNGTWNNPYVVRG